MDAAVGRLELRIRKIVPSNRRAHAGASNIPAFDTLIVDCGMYLMLEDVSRVGCGGGLPRIAYSRNWALESVISPPRTYKTREIDVLTMAADAYLVPEA